MALAVVGWSPVTMMTLIPASLHFVGSVVCGKLLEQQNVNFGYDSAVGEFKDLFEAGIIDPVKVVRTALNDAASIAGLLTTTETVITDIPQPASPPAAGGGYAGMGGAGMGGMGGMG